MLRRFSKGKGSSDTKPILARFLDFMESPIWALPIATFIEQRSVVFDRQQGSIALYEQIHKEFGELVDTLIECFCADSNITLDSLQQALKSAEVEKLSVKQKTSLEPIAAAENFNVFVPMMMRKNVELQLQALQMIEFMCGLIPSVLQIEEGESLRNKARVISPEETERYVLIAVMRQSKEEFDSLSRQELDELEEVLRSSEEERRRLEMEHGKEQELLTKALAMPGNAADKASSTPGSSASVTAGVSADQQTDSAVPTKTAESSTETAQKTSTDAPKEPVTVSTTAATAEPKQVRPISAKKDRRESTGERPPSAKASLAAEKDRRQSVGVLTSKSPVPAEPRNGSERPPTKRAEGRPPTTKRSSTPTGDGRAQMKTVSSKERRVRTTVVKPSTEARRRKEDANGGTSVEKKANPNEPEDPGMMHGPRGKNIYDVNALLQQPNRLNSAAVRSREEYLRMQRDRLLAMKANEREKQLNEVSQRAVQERPRTAKAARGLMRSSRAGIGTDDVLAARRAIVEQLKTEIDNAPTA